MAKERKFGTRKTRLFAFCFGGAFLVLCLFLSVVTDVPPDFLYKMAMGAVALSGLYITGRSATHFANNRNNAGDPYPRTDEVRDK